MRSILFAALLTTVGAAQAALTPIQCSQAADMLYMILNGQRFPVPGFAEPVLRRAIEHVQANRHQEDAYWHSTNLFLECVRTGGVADAMYDPKHMRDPAKVPTSA